MRTLDEMLNGYNLPHMFEIYEGNHVNRIADRVEAKVLPFSGRTRRLNATRIDGPRIVVFLRTELT